MSVSGQEFAALAREQRGLITRALRRCGVVERDLPDAEQEVLVIMYRRLASFEGRSSFASWVYGIARNVASDQRRAARHKRELLDETLAEPQSHSQPQLDGASLLETRELVRHALSELAKLPDDQRAVFVANEVEEQTMSEVAAQQRVPLKTAYSRLYAARRQLQAALRRVGVSSVLGPRLAQARPSELVAWLRRVCRPRAGNVLGVPAAPLTLTMAGIVVIALCWVRPSAERRAPLSERAQRATVSSQLTVTRVSTPVRGSLGVVVAPRVQRMSTPMPNARRPQSPTRTRHDSAPARAASALHAVNVQAAEPLLPLPPEAPTSTPAREDFRVLYESGVDSRPYVTSPLGATLYVVNDAASASSARLISLAAADAFDAPADLVASVEAAL